ncbi:hypothetical protein E3P89_00669 [Wallemia ichthyophaga]|uniref:Peptidase S59 domain-containing protein n=1 Tax=Wallemia ichthyophaga TaxID=245174 RepID=A0A4T0IAV6_WALIC|nr:hypothetical protein E3P98_01059 [Wallemia ichthyophaga]TIB15050.1 hypothetical protein E3P90_01035 [Wallemia ichthyophaga]TIB16894.1 hypothetical protein E3P93_00892 [Wallemia ichthyophaga]TIB25042.1 hypothetical protein E3P89_00669 [Wallemia ichthyophaga]TIB26628.1 hypothetical protein E3P88_00904 [Wallemia ichthyophaga]
MVSGFSFGGGGTGGFGSSGSAFGGSSTPAFGSGGFGQQQSQQPQQQTGAFGQPAQTPAFGSSAGGFGSSGGAFGQSNTPSTGLFGASRPPQQGSGFSFGGGASAAPAAPQANPSPFGAPAPASTSTFGQPAPTAFGSSLGAGGASADVKGTDPFEVNQRVEDPKGPDRITDRVKFHSINTEAKFQPFSFEELRMMDYERGTRNSSQAPSTGGFGASTSGGFGSTFGAPSTGSAFGQSAGTGAGAGGFGSNTGSTGGGLFGSSQPQQNSAFGGSSGGFGQSQPSQPAGGGGLFGQSNTQSTPFGGGSTGSAFGQQPKPSLFGSTSTNTPFGGAGGGAAGGSAFGQSNPPASAPFGQSSTGGGFGSNTGASGGTGFSFGQPASTTPATGGFGAAAQPSTGGGLFGQSAQKPAFGGASSTPFGQSSTGGGFGSGATGGFGQSQPSQPPAGGGLFGQSQPSQPPAGGGLFGQQQNSQQQPSSTGFGSGGLGGFGQQNKPATSGFGGFGSTNTGGTGGGFGAGASTGAGGFGQNQSNTGASGATGGGLFGGQQNQQQQPSTGGFGSGGSGFSFGQNSQQQQPQQPAQQQQPSSGFNFGGGLGGTQNKPATGGFGSGFGSNTGTGGSTGGGGLFGGGLGSSANNNNTGTGGGGLFGGAANNTSTGGGLFGGGGASAAPKPAGGLFGSTGTGGGFGGGLGQSSTAQPAQNNTGGFGGGSLFGQSTQQNSLQQSQPNLSASVDQSPYGANPLFDLGPNPQIGPTAVAVGGASTVNKKKPVLNASASMRSPARPLNRLRGFAASPGTPISPSAGVNLSSSVMPPSSPSMSVNGGMRSSQRSLNLSRAGSPAASTNGGVLSGLPSENAMSPNAFMPRSSVKKLVIDRKPIPDSPSAAASGSPNSLAQSKTGAKVSFNPHLEKAAQDSHSVGLGDSISSTPHENTPLKTSNTSQFVKSTTPTASPPPSTNTLGSSVVSVEASPQIEEGHYYSIPSVDELNKYSYRELKSVEGLKVGRKGYGEIHFLEPVDLTTLDGLNELTDGQLVVFESRVAYVYPDGVEEGEDNPENAPLKPAPGRGLNVAAEIELEGCWPKDKATGEYIKDDSHPKTLSHLNRLKKVSVGLALGAILFFWTYELHIELAKYRRGWVKTAIKQTEPLGGCFARASEDYELRQITSPKYNQLQSGLSYKHGFDCYGHSRLVQMQDGQGKVRSTIHLYWRSDIAPLGYREKVLLDSILATQDLDFVDIKLWSNGDLQRFNEEFLEQYLHDFPHHFSVGNVDLHGLAKGTPLEASDRLNLNDQRAWLDGDVVRILLLWNYGGVWVDMDSILTRDLQPLLEHEFVTQWDCYDKPYSPLNGAMMHFKKHSPYLCEMMHIMQYDPEPRQGSTDWGALLYHKTHRRLLNNDPPIKPFEILPYCFTDGRSCRLDNRILDPFEKDPSYTDLHWLQFRERLSSIFAIHLHGQYSKKIPEDGWMQREVIENHRRKITKIIPLMTYPKTDTFNNSNL